MKTDTQKYCIMALDTGVFVSTNKCMFNFAERPCSYRELASYHLAKYKSYKNLIKIEEV